MTPSALRKAVVELAGQNLGKSAVATRLGINRATVHRILKRPHPVIDHEKLLALYDAGELSTVQIARLIGCNRRTVSRIAKAAGRSVSARRYRKKHEAAAG